MPCRVAGSGCLVLLLLFGGCSSSRRPERQGRRSRPGAKAVDAGPDRQPKRFRSGPGIQPVIHLKRRADGTERRIPCWVVPGDLLDLGAGVHVRHGGESRLSSMVQGYLVRVDGRLRGLRLAGDDVHRAVDLLRRHGEHVHTVTGSGRLLLDPAVIDALGALPDRELTLVVTGFGGRPADLDRLARLRDRLTGLTLDGPGVTDRALRSVARLTRLTALRLDSVPVTDRGLDHLRTLSALRSLGLAQAAVSDAGLSHLRAFAGLQALCLAQTDITDAGLRHLAALRQLRSLDLRATRVTGEGLAHLATLRHLALLDLRTAARERRVPTALVTDPGVLEAATGPLRRAAQQRRAVERRIRDIGPRPGTRPLGLARIRELRRKVRERYEQAMERQRRLALRFIPATRGQDLAAVRGLTSLRVVRLWLVTRADLEHLSALGGLQEIRAGGWVLEAAGFARLGRLAHLRRLRLHRVRATGDWLAGLRALTRLEELGLVGCPVTVRSLPWLAGLKRLVALDLSHTGLVGESLAPLASLIRLRDLRLVGTRITSAGLQHLGRLAHLRWLDLSETWISDEGLAHLAGLPRLAVLRLAGTALRGQGLRHLARLPRLTHLDLAHTFVQPAGLPALDGLPALRLLDLTRTYHLKQAHLDAFRQRNPHCRVIGARPR